MTNPLKLPGYLYTLIAIVLAVIVGLVFGTRIQRLGDVALAIIQLIKLLAIPLIFLAILDTLLKRDMNGQGIFLLLLVSLINAIFAVSIALLISNGFRPGEYLKLQENLTESVALGKSLGVIELFAMGMASPSILAILSSIIMGAVIIIVLPRSKSSAIEHGVNWSLTLILTLMGWIVYLVPIAVFCSVSMVVGKYGFRFVGGLGVFLFFCLLGMILQVFIVYHSWIICIAGIGFRRFWSESLEPVLYGFGTNSSLATLPMTLVCLKRLGISDRSARLSACIGTNINNDGILLYQVVAVLFVAQGYGLNLSLMSQLTTALVCVVACLGVSGIPEAGVIALTLALTAVNIPLEHLPLLLTVDWILARARSAVNVLGDITVAIGIETLSRRRQMA